MNEKLLCWGLLMFLLFSSSCQKKQVAQKQVGNSINQAQEDQEEHYLPPGSNGTLLS